MAFLVQDKSVIIFDLLHKQILIKTIQLGTKNVFHLSKFIKFKPKDEHDIKYFDCGEKYDTRSIDPHILFIKLAGKLLQIDEKQSCDIKNELDKVCSMFIGESELVKTENDNIELSGGLVSNIGPVFDSHEGDL